MDKIYNVLDSDNFQVGFITLTENSELIVSNRSFTLECNNINEVFDYIEGKELHLTDMQGDIYNRLIHSSLVENVKNLGIGYIVR